MTAGPHDDFNNAVSLVVLCEDQAELDRYWNALLEGGGKPVACGWLIDRFGQWVTSATNEVTADPDLVNAQSGSFGTPTITIDGVIWTEDWTDPNALLQAVGS